MVEFYLENLNGNIARLKCFADGKKEKVFYIEIDFVNRKLLKQEGKYSLGCSRHAMNTACNKYERDGVFPKHGISLWH